MFGWFDQSAMSVSLQLLYRHQLRVGIGMMLTLTYQVGTDVIVDFDLEIGIPR